MNTAMMNSEDQGDVRAILFGMVAPFLGSCLASLMFAAPIADLRQALLNNSSSNAHQDDLNPRPWAIMTGNCLGWCAYGYYTHDPFVFMGNLPGLILSLWLNIGAAKLQYHQRAQRGQQDHVSRIPPNQCHNHDTLQNDDPFPYKEAEQQQLIWTPQEVWFLSIVSAWGVLLVIVGWVGRPIQDAAPIVGFMVNLNLIFLYGAPLTTIQQVVITRRSNSIHRPTMIMSCINTTFWLLYGLAREDWLIVFPNGTGLLLSLLQVVLCLTFPKRTYMNSTRNERTTYHDDDENGHEIEFVHRPAIAVTT